MFITNMIPLHSLALIVMGRYSSRLYVAFSSWYAVGTLASMQVPFVGFQPVSTSEHMGALGELKGVDICSSCSFKCCLRGLWIVTTRSIYGNSSFARA